jgi:hypothetical protein
MESKKKKIRLHINPDSNTGDTTMITKTTLIAALVLGTASVAMAQGDFDGNLANRYPAYAAPQASQVLEGRNVALTGAPTAIVRSQAEFDRASNPSAGGGF